MIYYDDVFMKHRPPSYHPENPKRLEIVKKALEERGLWKDVVKPIKAEISDTTVVHDREYVEFVVESCKRESFIDSDTYVCKDSLESALVAFGCSIQCVENAVRRRDMHLALVRPPGHHAGRRGKAFNAPSLGFCLFNNVAGAVSRAKEFFDEILVIDFDVHHGNGTQEIFWNDKSVIHIDFHEYGIYPGSGSIYETDGSKINIALPHYCRDDDYIHAWIEIVEPTIERIDPEVVIVSAGFDAFKDDGLATMELTEKFYSFAGGKLSDFSVIAVLEGGYSVGLERGLPAFIEGYMKGYSVEDVNPSPRVVEIVESLKRILRIEPSS
ncbi:MAG: histone deacetylase family protein [Archaeoglobales archaeon]|nr:MAG: histone deacetylase family protein [Archaeoglobales archaeon]